MDTKYKINSFMLISRGVCSLNGDGKHIVRIKYFYANNCYFIIILTSWPAPRSSTKLEYEIGQARVGLAHREFCSNFIIVGLREVDLAA